MNLAATCTGECQKSGPWGLAIVLLLCVACYFLFKSMSKHLKKVREEFPADPPSAPGAARAGGADGGKPVATTTSTGGSAAGGSAPSRPAAGGSAAGADPTSLTKPLVNGDDAGEGAR